MRIEEAWMWFVLTGAPEYYLLFRALQEKTVEKTA